MKLPIINYSLQTKKSGVFLLTIFAVVVFLCAALFGAGYYFGFRAKPSLEKIQAIENMEIGKPEAVDFGLFWDTWHELEKSFIGRKNIDRQKMVYGAISGLVNSLEDPYTVFMPPDEARQFEEDVTGSFDGIGAEIGMRKGVLTIISPLKDSPAEAAGVLAGDKILKIDDRLTGDLTVDQAVRLIRGQKGTEVRLLISRDSFEKAKEYKIIRQTIKIPVIKYEKKENGIFYIALYNFGQTSFGEFQKAVGEFLNSGATKLILDLRNNPGGYLEA
ncbi:MAG: PDZ domain-containing protein, partial [Patescibacteria group bacterium]